MKTLLILLLLVFVHCTPKSKEPSPALLSFLDHGKKQAPSTDFNNDEKKLLEKYAKHLGSYKGPMDDKARLFLGQGMVELMDGITKLYPENAYVQVNAIRGRHAAYILDKNSGEQLKAAVKKNLEENRKKTEEVFKKFTPNIPDFYILKIHMIGDDATDTEKLNIIEDCLKVDPNNQLCKDLRLGVFAYPQREKKNGQK